MNNFKTLAERCPSYRQYEINGDYHLHSNFSDGQNDIMDIAKAAKLLGHKIIGITDHSNSFYVHNNPDNLEYDKINHYLEVINQAQESIPEITILKGIECNIFPHGNLDLPDKILQKFDLVIASIHHDFRGNQTDRLMKAIKNKYVNIIGHPTGRYWGHCNEIRMEHDHIFQLAAKTGTAIEINCNPLREDLPVKLCKKAAEHRDLKLIINSDSHEIANMANVLIGVNIACHGNLSKNQLLNSGSPEKTLRFIRQKRNRWLRIIS